MQDPKPEQKKQPQAPPPADSQAEAGAEQQDQYLFYNVMPKGGGDSKVVAPTVTVIEPQASVLEPTPSFAARYKWYLILGVLAIILGIAGWFAYGYFSNPYGDSNLLVPMTQNSPGTDTEETKTAPAPPAEWLNQYFGSETCRDTALCGTDSDPDRDGMTNYQEFEATTDPNNADSDSDGLADGDETTLFGTNPLKSHSDGGSTYSDADYILGAYDVQTGQLMSPQQIEILSISMSQKGLHQPTFATLEKVLVSLYKFDQAPPAPAAASSTPVSAAAASSTPAVDQSPEAKQDRDAQRTNTIKNIGIALVKYEEDHGSYPAATDFAGMIEAIKPYNRVATNPVDPINRDPYVYTYAPEAANADFTLSYFSETVSQLIKKHAADALKDKNQSEAAVYDDERKRDLETLRSALLLYSNSTIAGNQDYVFPTQEKYKTSLVPEFISSIPKDPTTEADYEYKVSATFDAFTLKAILQGPPTGNTGYLCNQEECRYY